MIHSVSGCARGVRVKLLDPLRTRAIPERLTGVSRRGAIQVHVYLTLHDYVLHFIRHRKHHASYGFVLRHAASDRTLGFRQTFHV